MSSVPPLATGCPSWCATDHNREVSIRGRRDAVHRGVQTATDIRNPEVVPGYGMPHGSDVIDVRAWQSGVNGRPEIVFITNRGMPIVSLAVIPGYSPIGEPPEEGVAALVEVLADATPDAHRKIAAAIRAAAAAVTEGRDD